MPRFRELYYIELLKYTAYTGGATRLLSRCASCRHIPAGIWGIMVNIGAKNIKWF